MLRCSVETVGRSKPELRWIFRDTERRYVGPRAHASRYLDELQREVEEWSQMKKDLRQKDVNFTTLRAKLISEDN